MGQTWTAGSGVKEMQKSRGEENGSARRNTNFVSFVGIAWDLLSVKIAYTTLINMLAIKVSEVGLRVKSIRKLMDVSDIQPYTCNSSKLVYINRKGRNDHVNRMNGRKVDKCEVCGHELQCYSSKFCSIECKVQSEIEVEETEKEEVGISISTTRLLRVDTNSFRKRMRKGTPLRSPFF
ncbi:hypothetical protein ES332_D09G144600v1 [Gossypium tomentosum]|uniref:Uncharacterized protein n=1 Tax=Gossypium tomentosum TaxID=34277 RepID=A0A5D2JHW3_GOSTO|nr:hypothetical protein ES332_D09G144600v1 [Gossypium tomentosum]